MKTEKLEEKFQSEIEILRNRYPEAWNEGLIRVELQDIFYLIPRNRCRTDRYDLLAKYMKTIGVELIVISQKTRKKL